MAIPSMIRTRWSAVGAALAVSLGAGGVGLINATSPDGASAFVPITPCRLFDTRPAPHTVGGRTAPLGPDETYDISARGAQGNCTLPDSAVGVVLNVTAVDATQATFLTFFPTGENRPTASHLNPSPGAPPAPNAVTVDLSAAGEFSVFNRFGNVHVLADVVGYYTDHHHDDRYYTKPQADDRFEPLAQAPDAGTIRLGVGDLIPESSTEWVIKEGPRWNRTGLGIGCLLAGLSELPAGAVVEGIDVPTLPAGSYPVSVSATISSYSPVDEFLWHFTGEVSEPGDGPTVVHIAPTPGIAEPVDVVASVPTLRLCKGPNTGGTFGAEIHWSIT